MRALADVRTRQAWLVEGRVGPYRVGWFDGPGLVFAEGRPLGAELCAGSAAPQAMRAMVDALAAHGIPVGSAPAGGLRRLDVAVDVSLDSSVEGLGILECLGAQSQVGGGKIAVFRGRGGAESVVVRSRGGRTLARVYDKGVESGGAAPGVWLRFEAQWRLARSARPNPWTIGPGDLRDRFARRFRAVWQGAEGFRLGGVEALADRLQAAVLEGRLPASRARSIAGYLVLSAAGVPQGARRTTSELEREARELGLSVSLLAGEDRLVDVATVLDECLDEAVWI